MNAIYIEVSAEVRYWEDATVNGVVDIDGARVPQREGNLWQPVIRLEDGMVMDWPQGTEADIHYKVCDQGEYWLLDTERRRVAKLTGDYVPDSFLCHGGIGDGDYIILKIGCDGHIKEWKKPLVSLKEWTAVKREDLATPAASSRDDTLDDVLKMLEELHGKVQKPTPMDKGARMAIVCAMDLVIAMKEAHNTGDKSNEPN